MALSRAATVAIAVAVAVVVFVTGLAIEQSSAPSPSAGYVPVTRTYYIAAEPVAWNYTPTGVDPITGIDIGGGTTPPPPSDNDRPPPTAANVTPPYPQETFLQCAYLQYPNASFLVPDDVPANDSYLGLAGPVIYVAVGDTLVVTFHNACPLSESFTPSGLVALAGPAENSTDVTAAGGVVPGATVTYTWSVPASAGPSPLQGSSSFWTYTSAAAPLNGTDAGLYGGIIVTAADDALPDGAPADVQANVVLFFDIDNETNSPFYAYNVAHYAPNASAVDPGNPNWTATYQKFAINGFADGNLPLLNFTAGEHVRWYVAALGALLVTPYWQGNTVVQNGANLAVLGLVPGTYITADMWPNATGVWLVESANTDDIAGGMQARYNIVPSDEVANNTPTGPYPTGD
jgi:manganese oxidase